MTPKERKLINKHFRIVYEPKLKSVGAMFARVRFAVGAGQLEKYVGAETAFKAATNAYQSKRQIYTLRHRTFGRIDFYSK
ncbi:MAG TPA: hypothetical protein VHA56_16300 [Mucilaginibacter sp.]|nr:hypothetical protein [Mucilaginibacter sp.]